VPDISGDGLADVIIAAPHAGTAAGPGRGILVARSPKTGRELWRRVETASENLGWDLALAGDQNRDGYVDLFGGAPARDSGRVCRGGGKAGGWRNACGGEKRGTLLGGYAARPDVLDGAGHDDLAAGAPAAPDERGNPVGGAWILSSSTGRELHHWIGTDRRGG